MTTIGRPKKEGFDKIIKVTVNEQVAEMFDNTVKVTGKSKSDILRELIPIVSSKDFEDLIPNTRMEILQSYSEQCWDILHTPGCIFETENLSERMPAFITTIGQPAVYVKYPTYKIEIFDGKNPQGSTNQQEIESLLKEVENRSSVYATRADYLIIGKKITEMEFPFVNEVMCLEISLDKNISCKDKIVGILKKHDYSTSIYPAYCIRGEYIELLENKKYFRVLCN